MAQPVTEIAYIVLKPGLDIHASEPAQIWADTLKTLSQQDGMQKYSWGLQVENKDVIVLAVDWAQLSSHEKFIASSTYGPFVSHLQQITSNLYLHHLTTTPSPPTLLTTAPCIEFATFYSIEPGFLDNLKKFVNVLSSGDVKGYHGVVAGETVEKIAPAGKEEGKGQAASLLIGWDSVDAHMKFRETDLFKQNVGLIREKRGGVEMFHITFKALNL